MSNLLLIITENGECWDAGYIGVSEDGFLYLRIFGYERARFVNG